MKCQLFFSTNGLYVHPVFVSAVLFFSVDLTSLMFDVIFSSKQKKTKKKVEFSSSKYEFFFCVYVTVPLVSSNLFIKSWMMKKQCTR